MLALTHYNTVSMSKRFILSIVLLSSGLQLIICNDSIPLFRSYTATRTDKIPRIDGVLKDSCWQEGLWASDFIQQQPFEGKPASYPTEIKILYNSSYLFIAVRCHDGEPQKIRRILGARDVFMGDVTGIALDSYNNDKTAFEFNITAAGQKIDLKHKGNFEFDQNWNAVWDGKTGLEDSAWTAEFRIPFSQLRYANLEEHTWGMHFWRWIDRKYEESQWKLIPVNAPAMVYLFGDLNGISNIRSSRQIELLPYGLIKYAPVQQAYRNPFGNTRVLYPSIGFDAKLGLSSNFTIDATINPDFGQVEADPSVLNLTAFETFYEEKRPFFLEGNEIFDFNLDDDRVFYSRRIGQAPAFVPDIGPENYRNIPENSTILGAAKISGKTSGGLSVGIIESITAGEYGSIHTPAGRIIDTLVHPLTNFSVIRVIQEKNSANTIFGGIFTTSKKFTSESRILSAANNEAYTGGLDFEQYFDNKNWFISGKAMMSYLSGSKEAIRNIQSSPVHLYQRPEADYLDFDTTATSIMGTGGHLTGGKKGGKWRLQEKIKWRSPGFDLNNIGYLRQADIIGQVTEISYLENKPRKYSRNYSVSFSQSASTSFGGELVNAGTSINLENTFNNLWYFQFNWNYNFPWLETRELRGGPGLWMNARQEFASHIASNATKNFAFSACIHYQRYSHEDSRQLFGHLDFTWLPVRRFKLVPYVYFSDFINEYQYIGTFGPDYLMGRMKQKTLEFTFRAEFFITPEISLQYYGSPYFSVGRISRFYYVSQAGAKNTSERFTTIPDDEIMALPDNQFNIPSSEPGIYHTLTNPDFSFAQFRSNFVFRWEYKLGSMVYFVWSNNRNFSDNIPVPVLSDSFEHLTGTVGKNIFLIKFNYWFSI